MTPPLLFEFLVDKDKHAMTIRREYDAKRQLVWDCHTRRDLLDQWFAPEPMTTRTKVMDFRDGGHWHYCMIDPGGAEYWGRMDYTKIRPIDSYSALDAFCDAQGLFDPNLPRAEWDVFFTDQGARTLVRTEVSYPSAEGLQQVLDMGMQDGMTSTMERLDKLLAAHPGR